MRVVHTLVLLVALAIMSWFVVQTTIFLAYLAVAVFFELSSVVATSAYYAVDNVVSRCVFISRLDWVSAVRLMLNLRKSRPQDLLP